MGSPAPVATSTRTLGESPRLADAGHESPGAGLDVHDQRLDPRGAFLRQDRGRDQGDRLDRRGDVPDGIEPGVGRGEIGRGAHDGAAGVAHNALELGLRHAGAISRDGFELVERPPSMAKATSGHHRHEGPASREGRRQDQTDVVADPASRMLVDQGPWEDAAAPRQRRTRTCHALDERHGLGPVHAFEVDRHGKGRDLLAPDAAARQPRNEGLDLAGRQHRAVALPADDLLWQQPRPTDRERVCRRFVRRRLGRQRRPFSHPLGLADRRAEDASARSNPKARCSWSPHGSGCRR